MILSDFIWAHLISFDVTARSQEVKVHLDVLRAQHRVAQDEKHATAVELAERKRKIYSLKMKYVEMFI